MPTAKHPGGRPTKYKPEFIQEVDNYLASVDQTHLPKLVSFALRIGVNDDTLTEWEKKYPEFSVALDKIRSRQHEQLIDDGIYGGKEVNATIVKLLLQNNFKYIETERKELVGKDNKDLFPQPLLGGAAHALSNNNSD